MDVVNVLVWALAFGVAFGVAFGLLLPFMQRRRSQSADEQKESDDSPTDD